MVGSVSEARDYMENNFPFKDRSYYRCPDLIVTDYRLNSHTALDFITWLYTHPTCAETPVVILTGTSSAIPPQQLSHIKPAGYIVKTPDVSKLAEVLKHYLPWKERRPSDDFTNSERI